MNREGHCARWRELSGSASARPQACARRVPVSLSCALANLATISLSIVVPAARGLPASSLAGLPGRLRNAHPSPQLRDKNPSQSSRLLEAAQTVHALGFPKSACRHPTTIYLKFLPLLERPSSAADFSLFSSGGQAAARRESPHRSDCAEVERETLLFQIIRHPKNGWVRGAKVSSKPFFISPPARWQIVLRSRVRVRP